MEKVARGIERSRRARPVPDDREEVLMHFGIQQQFRERSVEEERCQERETEPLKQHFPRKKKVTKPG